MNLDSITTLIAAELKKELDIPFKLMLADKIQFWRSRFIKNSLDKDERERKYFRQTIMVPMQEVSETQCVELGYPGCTVARSIPKLPQPVRANGILFDYAGDVTGANPFRFVMPWQIPYLNQSRFSKKDLNYAWESEHLIVYGNPKIPMVRIDGIFNDPTEAIKLSCNTDGTPCDLWTTPYPVSGDVLQLVIQAITEPKVTPITSKEVPVSVTTNKDI